VKVTHSQFMPRFFAGCALICATEATLASPFSWTLGRYQHTAYTKRDGAPKDSDKIAETSDGLLWLTGDRGLTVFDGQEFRPFVPFAGEHLINSQVSEVYAPRSGGLWVSYGVPGVSFINHGHITNYDKSGGWTGGTAEFFSTRAGDVLAFGYPGLFKFSGGSWKQIDAKEHEPDFSQNLAQDSSFNLWTSDANGEIYVLMEGENKFTDSGTKVAQAFSISTGSGGNLFVSTRDKLVHRFLAIGTKLQEVGSPIPLYAEYAFEDHRGNLWVGTVDDGVHFFGPLAALPRDPTVSLASFDQKLSQANGLTGNFAVLSEDRQGNIWAGTENGIDKLMPSAFSQVPLPSGITMISIAPGGHDDAWIGSENFNVIHVVDGKPQQSEVPRFAITTYADDRDGSVYAATVDDLWQLAPGSPKKLAQLPVHGGGALASMTRDRQGRIWAAIHDTQAPMTWDGETWASPVKIERPFSLATDTSGVIWAGYMKNRLVSINGGITHKFSAANGLAVGIVKVITAHAGAIWLGGDEGLQLFKNGTFQSLRLDGQTALRDISGVLFDRGGNLWVHTLDGLFRISSESIKRVLSGATLSMPYRLFDADDGLPGTPSQMHALPSLVLGSDGRLWISGSQSAAWLDPDDIPALSSAPPPLIEQLSDGNTIYDVSRNHVHLPKDARNIQIDYTSPELTRPKYIHFQYRLAGFDSGWQDVGARRQAFYSHLSSGEYAFEVRAANDSGGWSTSPATLSFDIAPRYFETWWFRLLGLVVTASLIFMAFRLQVNRTTSRLYARMRIRAKEREAVARDLHDTLLQSTQALVLQLEAISMGTIDAGVQQELRQLARMTNDAVLEGRNKVRHLRSEYSDTEDYVAELKKIGDLLSRRYKTEFSLGVSGRQQHLIPSAKDETQRILGEALANAFQHANAKKVSIELTFGLWKFKAIVTDDGTGFVDSVRKNSVVTGHWGVKGMYERAREIGARLSIRSARMKGTVVTLVLPPRRAYANRFRWF